jgi:hypothetical protein
VPAAIRQADQGASLTAAALFAPYLKSHADELIAKAVSLALEGDTTALRICIDRLIAPLRAKDETVKLGSLEGPFSEQGKTILNAVAIGHITPDQAGTLMQAIAAQARKSASETSTVVTKK